MDVQQAVNQAATSQREITSKGSNGGKSLGKDDFLNLMMTQMSYQDPLDPMDSEQMMQQFAQLGTVEQLQNLNKKVDQMLVSQSDMVQSSAYSFLGKDVELGGNTVTLSKGQASPISYQLEGDAERVSVQIIDHEGQIVKTLDQGAQGPGSYQANWDGMDTEGDVASDQTYRYKVVAKTAEGEDVPSSLFRKGRVSSISFANGRPMLHVNGEVLPLESIRELNQLSEARFGSMNPLPLKEELLPSHLAPSLSPLKREDELP